MFFQRSRNRTESENWIYTISKLKRALRQEYGRSLTVPEVCDQKVHVHLCLPSFMVSVLCFAIQKDTFKANVTAIYQHIWNEKFLPKFKTKNIFIHTNHGGLRVIHVQFQMKELFIGTMLEQTIRKKILKI